MNKLVKYWKHFQTITKHRWYVFLECCRYGIPFQGLVHDLSKYSPSEFIASGKYWTGVGSPVEAERDAVGYSYAWRYHKGRNRHHWQWYVDVEGDRTTGKPKLTIAPMPLKYIMEMIADVIGAGRAYSGVSKGIQGVCEYYHPRRNEWLLNPETRDIFEQLIYYRAWKESKGYP